MNLHFEDRQKLRALSQPVEPQRDLWPAIAAHIETQARAPRRRMQWLAVAASLACAAAIVGAVGIRALHSPAASRAQIAAAANIPARWKPSDPRLRGAAVELHAARGELQQALAIAPHSPYLQRLLQNTEHQQSRLRRLDVGAG